MDISLICRKIINADGFDTFCLNCANALQKHSNKEKKEDFVFLKKFQTYVIAERKKKIVINPNLTNLYGNQIPVNFHEFQPGEILSIRLYVDKARLVSSCSAVPKRDFLSFVKDHIDKNFNEAALLSIQNIIKK